MALKWAQGDSDSREVYEIITLAASIRSFLIHDDVDFTNFGPKVQNFGDKS